MSTVGIGTWRALERASTNSGVFAVLAIDHQDALRRAMRPYAPHALTVDELTSFKLDVLESLHGEASAVLLDPILSAPQAVAAGLTRQIGLLVELEKADYELRPLPRAVEIDPDWGAAKIKRMGADGVKLFFYYNPSDRGNAAVQERLLRRVAEECKSLDIPLYAEPILYDAPPADFTSMVIEAARRAEECGATVLKLEFPVPLADGSPNDWESACEAVTRAVNVPWVLLSAGVDFETFARQVEIACSAGASGFIAGRAVWGDAAAMPDSTARRANLKSTVYDRFVRLLDIANRTARSFHRVIETPEVSPEWFRTYISY